MADTRIKRFADKVELPPVPGFADWSVGGERRAEFWRYWLKSFPKEAREYAIYQLFRLMPLPLARRFGAYLGRRVGEAAVKNETIAYARAKERLSRLRPDIPARDYATIYPRYTAGVGRQYAEFAHLARLTDPKRLEIQGLQHLASANAKGPVVMIYLHLANWEIGSVLARLGYKASSFFDPPMSRVRRKVAVSARLKSGLELHQPNQAGVRQALRNLSEGGVVMMFCDETGVEGESRAPFFGRPPETATNLGFVSRLARKSGAALVCIYALRGEDQRLTLHITPPIAMPDAPVGADQTLTDVVHLNAYIEPIITRHIDQWYWLDNR